ncbi:uncharacterized protein LOC117340710 [Pecten maximus]|uniref:uncharacterized protein LOC117340710 n=1 Tax=Pecten maximus TaxID=6579 RepID=UPI001457F95C|nr:uncharacterized protein LOC117340710 [Pecten maximus]
MARLRFPGRPGCRFDRMGVRYGADDAKNVNDPTLVLVASIHRGLRLFRELFGESDEEEDFEGFTQKDVQKSEKKLKAMLAQCESSPEKVTSFKPIGSRLAKAKEKLASPDRGRGIRKSYTELLKHGIVKPSKSSMLKQAREETQKSLKIKFKVKKEKSGSESSPQFSQKVQVKRKSVETGVKKTGAVNVKQKKGKKDGANEETPQYSKKKVKERDKLSVAQGSKGVKGQQNLAKQLLQKARKGQQTVKVPGKVKSPVTSPKSPRGPAYPRKQFVLPTQSSRSSRVIIPNKRFLEQDDFNQIMTKRSRVEDSTLSPKSETFPVTSARGKVPEKSKVKAEQMKSPQLTSLPPGPPVRPPPGHLFDPIEAGQTLSLYDQPLIVEGKRARKPSLKVRIKLTDERIQAFQVKSFEKKLQARKTIEEEKAAVGGVQESKRVHLTPSKLAGAVTSPSKLPTSPIFAPPKFGVSGQSALSERQRLEALEKEALATRRKGHNILRKAKLQLSRSALNRSKADFARTLKKEIKMEAKLEKMRLKQGSAVGGFSKVSGYSTFAGVAKSYMDAKDDQPGPGGQGTESGMPHSTREGLVCAVCKDSNLPPVRRRNYYGVPCCDGCRRFYRVHMKRAKEKEFFCNGNCNTDIRRCVFCRYLRCQEVLPAEDKLKPLKDSPTKRLVQGDSAENTEGLMSPPKTIPATAQIVGELEEGVSAPLTSSPESVASSPASEGRGPRIKHVCRKAAVVLGKPVAKFPQTSPQSSLEITLSALPRGEKVKLWKKEEESKAGLSDDERTLDEIIQQSEDNVCTVKRSPHKSPALNRLIPGSRGRLTVRRRKLRCKKCPGCLAKDCGKCLYCQDKPKFGGRGVMKQACMDRKCEFPRYSRAATAAFIKPKDPPPESQTCDQGCNTPVELPEPSDPSQNTAGCGNPNTKNGNGTSSSMNLIRRMVLQSQGNARPEGGVKHSGDPDPAIRTPANISRQLLPHFSGGLSRENLSQKSGRQSPLVPPFRPGDPSKKPGLGVLSPKKLPKAKDRNLTVLRSENCVLQPLPSTLRHWPQSGYRIKAEFKENYDIEKAWQSGVPLTMSGPLCVRTICYLCGSAGKHEFVFCNVCCEPFHEFCLEEEERPTEDNRENWCCHRCQFCHVCGEQYNLLRCDKCQNTYHPECLGPNYPTKPSKKKKIWVCTKCVRCKSCGSTTPGNAGHATWTYDFQLCYECGKLMDKGNFCPMCHKCYSDDDWESKMVQCVTCESWVHAKCEGLNDEMYERVSFLPEDVHYICKMCSPSDRPRHWELVLRDDLQAGIKSVFYTLLNAKCAQHLLHIDVKNEPIQKEEVSKGGSSSTGTAEGECNKESSSVEGVKDCDRTACDENKQLEDSKSVGGDSKDSTATKESLVGCNQEPVTMETDTVDVESITDSKCDSNSSDKAKGNETGLEVGREVSGDGERVGFGGKAYCDNRSGEGSVSEKLVPCSAGDLSDSDSEVPMEIDQLCEADGTASGNEPVGGSSINRTASVNDLQRVSETGVTDFKNDLVEGSAIDETASQKEGGNDDGIATQKVLNTRGASTDLKDEVDGGQAGVQAHVYSDSMLDQSQSIIQSQPFLSSEKSEDQSALEKSKSIDQSEVISITDDNQIDSIPHTTDQSNSIIQDCKVESDQSDLSLHLKSTLSDDVSKIEVKTEENKLDTTANIDNNNSLELKCEASETHDTKCEASRTDETKCETSLIDDTKCEMSQTNDTECDTCQIEDSKCDKSPTEDRKCESPRKEDTKCESPQKGDTKCENKKDDLKCETSKDNKECETSKDNKECETKCATPEKLTLSPMTDVSLVTPKKSGSLNTVHVRFSEKSGFLRQVAPTRDYPHDFSAVKVKMASDKYINVEEFSEDMAHIISQALNDPLDQRIVRKKNNNSVRSMFVKQMERCFPWFNIKTCKLWDQQQNLPGGMLPDSVIPPSEDHTYAQWLERQETPKSPQPSPFKKLHSTPIPKALPIAVDEDAEKVLSCDLEDAGEDMRRCILCWHYGDADPNDAGRLVYTGQDDWIHINCALWSAEAYEEELDGSLQNVHAAVSRGKLLKCDHCNRSGATVGCCMRGCPANYHFMCARHSYCVFQEDKKVFCSLHRDKVDGELVARDRFAVNRRVLVDMEGVKWAKKTWAKGLDPAVINVLIGSCTVESLGRLTPSSDYRDCLAPAEFSSSRVFWSTRDARRRCVYSCRIVEVKPDSPKSIKVVLKDVTIIHDESHPDYVPLSTLDIPGVNLFPDTESLNNKNNNSFKSDIIDLSGESCELDGCLSYQSSSVQGQGLSSSYNGSSSTVNDSQSDKLSSSWPLVKKKSSKVDLSLLSPKTLKLLNIKDPEKYKKTAVPETPPVKPVTPSVVNENNFSGFLTKIADRLNQAAARNIVRKDGEKTPASGGRPGRARSNSVERMTCSRSSSVERLAPSPLSHVRSKSVERFATSPLPCSRSRSNSTERDFLASSPGVLPENNTELGNGTETNQTKDSDGNATFSTASAEESMDQSGITLDSSLEPIAEEGDANVENIRETVIVLPEDCGELTEEEVLAIAQAALEQEEGEGTMELQQVEAACEEKVDTLQENQEDESQEESNFVKQSDTNENHQIMETNDGEEISEHKGEITTENPEEVRETIQNRIGQIIVSDSDEARETTSEQSAEVIDQQGEINQDSSCELKETTSDSQGEVTKEHSAEEFEKSEETWCDDKQSEEIQGTSINHSSVERETTVDDPRKTLVERSGEVKENVSDPQDATLQKDKDCKSMDTEAHEQNSGSKINDQGEVTQLDLTSDSSDELEADLNDVILIDIKKGQEEPQESGKSGKWQEIGKSEKGREAVGLGKVRKPVRSHKGQETVISGKDHTPDIQWSEDMYLCSSSGCFVPNNSSESMCNKDLTESVSDKDLIESESSECLSELAPTKNINKSVSDKGLMENKSVSDKSLMECLPASSLTDSVLDDGSTRVQKLGLTDQQDEMPTGEENESLNDQDQFTQGQKLADKRPVDKTEMILDSGKDDHAEITSNSGESGETMWTNQDGACNVSSTSANQQTDHRPLEDRNKIRGNSVKESNSIEGNETAAIDLTGDDLEDDLEEATKKSRTKSGEGTVEQMDIMDISLSGSSDTADEDREDRHKIIRREPLHFLRPIEMEDQEPVRQRKNRKKSPMWKSKDSKKDKPDDIDKSRSHKETDSLDGASSSSSKVAKETTSDTKYENSEHGTIESTIHLNIVTKSGEVENCAETEIKKGDNSQCDENQPLDEKDLPQHEKSDETHSAEIVEPVYNAKNELIGHRVVVSGDSNGSSETSDAEKRISPTIDLWNMVVRELVSENPEKFHPIKTDVSQSEEAANNVDDLDHNDKEDENLSSGQNMLAETCDPHITKGDNSAKDQSDADISEVDSIPPLFEVPSVKTTWENVNEEDQTADNLKDKVCSTTEQTPVSNTPDVSPVNKTPVKAHTEEEKRLEKEKTEILKGLGLARTPTGNEETSSPETSSKSSPLKKYPLRHRRSNSGHSDDSPVKGEMDWWSEQKLPIHVEIAQKIKAESLAKSIPGAKGPFKCPTCKRLYRTRESFKTHVKSCDFEVSTSDEEEEEEEEEKVEEEAKDGRRRYSVREHTMEARKAMEGEMRARVVLQNRETSPSKKRGRPKRSLNEDHKDLSNHIGSQAMDDGTPPVKRGRGRPKASPDVMMPDCQDNVKRQKNRQSVGTGDMKDGTSNSPETFGSKGKRGRPPKLKSPLSLKSPVKEKGRATSAGKADHEGVRKRGRPPLKSPKTEPEEGDNKMAGIKRSPLKSLTPTKADIVRKRGRPSLKFSPKKVFVEEDIVPRKKERLFGGGLKSPPLRSPVRGLVGSPKGRGRPPKTNSPSVKIECKEERVMAAKTEQQEVTVHCGEVSPTRRRGRPAKKPKSPDKIENDQNAVKDRPSIFEIFPPVEGSVGNVLSPEGKSTVEETSPVVIDSAKSPEVKRKRGRPFKYKQIQGKEPLKRDENNRPLEGRKLSPDVKGRKSDLKVKDGMYTESGRPSRRTASLALQKFEDNLGTDTDDTLDNDENCDQDCNSATGSEKVKGNNSNEAATQKDDETETNDCDSINNSRKKLHFIPSGKETMEDCSEEKGSNVTSPDISNASYRQGEVNKTTANHDLPKEGSSASSAIVIDSENEEEQKTEEETCEQISSDGQSLSTCKDGKMPVVCEQTSSDGQSLSTCKDGKMPVICELLPATINTEPNNVIQEVCSAEKEQKHEVMSQWSTGSESVASQHPEFSSKKTCITMVGAGFTKCSQEPSSQSTDNFTSLASSHQGRGGKLMLASGSQMVEKDKQKDPGQIISTRTRNTSSESNAKTQTAGSSSNAGIGENMVHPTTPMSIRDLLQQKMAIAPKEKPGYQVVTIHRPKSADMLKEDIRSILPVLPANILEQLRDPKQRIGAVKMIQNLIKVKSASTKSVEDITPLSKFTVPHNLTTREGIQSYIRSHIGQRSKESGVELTQQPNIIVTSQHVTPEVITGPSYGMVSPSDPRLLSPAAMATGFQVMSPTNNSLAGTIVQVPGTLPYQLSPPQPIAQLSPRIPIATNSANQLSQLSPQVQMHTPSPRASIAPLMQPQVNPQILRDMSRIQQLQNLQASHLPPFNIAPSSVSVSQQPLPPFNIAASPQSVLGVTSTPTAIGQRAVFMGPPMGAFNIPQVSGMRPQEGVSSLPGTMVIPQQVSVAPQMYTTPQMVTNTYQPTDHIVTGNSSSSLPSVLTGEETDKKNPNTLVRIFVDGKPVAVTTDPSVLNNHDKLLSRLGSTNLQAGTYSITVSTHKMSVSTNTLTMAGQSSLSCPVPLAPKSSDGRVLHSLLKTPPVSSYGAAVLPTVTTSTQASSIMSTGQVSTISNSAIKKFLSRKEMTSVTGLHSYVKNTDGKVRKPMIKPNIIHKKRVTGSSSLSKKVLVTMEKNGMIQGAIAKAVMRKLVRNSNEVSPKKKIVFRGLTAGEGVQTTTSDSKNIPSAAETNTGKLSGSVTKSPRIRKVTPANKIKVNNIKKGIRRRKTPLKARNVALPHVTGVMSHPILHAQKELLTLPQPAVEEEVVATPYSRANDSHGRLPSRDSARSKNEPYLAFEISSDDGFSCHADSMDEAWRQVAEKVQDARVAARMKQLSFQSMSGVTMFGVNHNSLRYLIEQLYGMQHFRNYETLYHHYDLSPEEEEPTENPTGCIRTEGYHGRKPFDMFSFLMSTYRRKPDPVHAGKSDVEMNLKSQRRATSMDLPMAMRFRKLKEHSREAVGVYRSHIHGRGLFCKRNIDGGEMIIEYAGEVIRSSLTDKREKYYESKGIGCYMFRIDDVDVVDATMRGSAARFINHSCEPNCYSKVIQVDGKKHIVIFASRAIKRGEELTYDYKFPIEEVKIPCTCGQKRCRKYLN